MLCQNLKRDLGSRLLLATFLFVQACFKAKNVVSRAELDLKFHFTKRTLKQVVSGAGLRCICVIREYFQGSQSQSFRQFWVRTKSISHALSCHCLCSIVNVHAA